MRKSGKLCTNWTHYYYILLQIAILGIDDCIFPSYNVDISKMCQVVDESVPRTQRSLP